MSLTPIGHPPPNKRQRLNPPSERMPINTSHASITRPLPQIRRPSTIRIPRISTYNMRTNADIDTDVNPLIQLHKTTPIRHVTESIRLYSKIKKFCIGKERKSLKKIHITSQSPSSGLCSKHIETALIGDHAQCQLPSLSFCLTNYECGCFIRNADTGSHKGIHTSFTIPQRLLSCISNCNYPSTVLSIEINDAIVGYFFVKTSAPSNLKRMAQPSTFSQFRMSISQCVELRPRATTYNRINGLRILIKSRTNNAEFGVGIGYYFTARAPHVLDIVCCMTNVEDTEFEICCDECTASTIHNIRCKMHIEESTTPLTLFEYVKPTRSVAPVPRMMLLNPMTTTYYHHPLLNPLLSLPYSVPMIQYVPQRVVQPAVPQTMYAICNNIVYKLN